MDRPDRKTRRMRGKSDPIDLNAAATAVLSGWPPAHRRAGTAWSRRCGCCGPPAATRPWTPRSAR
ncbi:hypothetical protein [Streptomyces sp. NPDC003032]